MSYYISRNGQPQEGPYSEGDLQRMLSAGQLSSSDFAWKEGQANWEPLHRLFPYFVGPAMLRPEALAPQAGDGTLASRGVRLGAALLDGFFQLLAFAPIMAGLPAWIEAIENSPESLEPGNNGAALQLLLENLPPWSLVATGVLVIGLLGLNIFLLTTRGQSLAKMLCRIRIVRFPGGQPPGFVKAWLLRSFVPYLLTNIPIVGGMFGLADALFIFSKDKRCVHDHIAGTKVVRC
ncbi:MAG: RDD family protein [Verrucomicrobiales bacterium]|nr:RDD family protein [Verrucomicrobiales bacterium]